MKSDRGNIVDRRAGGKERLAWLAGLILALGTVACYWPARHFDFVSYDDPVYVAESSMVQRGLTWPGFTWAFKGVAGGNWNPLVWLSHMADCQFYGLNPGGHHVTNFLLHTVNVLLLFLVFKSMTGAIWRSAFVAAVFAWHPMHVESVAWVSERKDVLSTVFFLSAIRAYASFAKAGNLRRKKFYVLALLLFALGLMCKAMLVTLPLVFLLLDYWPLRRTEPPGKLVMEKLPFLAMSVVASGLAVWAQKGAGALGTAPLPLRLENAALSYVTYFRQLLWPVDLACFYPFSNSISGWATAGAVLLLTAVSCAVIWGMQQRQYLAVGWFWFLGTLAPVIGVVQVGMQATADRYTYIPYIGLAVIFAWGMTDVAETLPRSRVVLTSVAVLALAACIAGTVSQLKYWRDSVALYEHALKITTDNYLIMENLGVEMGKERKLDEAVKLLEESIRLKPDRASPYYNLAKAYAMEHRIDDAVAGNQQALRLAPNSPKSLNNLAWIYATCPRADLRNGAAAVKMATRACEITRREDMAILDTLAAAYAEAGQFDEAIKTAEEIRDTAIADHNTNMENMARQRLELYRAGKPYRDRE